MDRLPPGEGLCKLWKQQSRSFEELATFSIRGYHLTGLEYPERYSAVRISSSLLPMLGVQPALGRAFHQEDDGDGSPGVVMLGYDLWQRRFGADPAVLGRSLQLNQRPYTIIGVMPPGFDFPRGNEMPVRLGPDRKTELWLGLGQRTETEIYDSNVLALLRPGISAAAVQMELNASLPPPGSANPGHAGLEVILLREHIVRGLRPALLILLAAVGSVLLMGCANLAGLALARASGRRREMAVRSALGAGRGRIIRLLLAENLALAALGGAGGLALYAAATSLLTRLAPADLPRLDQVPLDWRVLGFSAGVTILTGLLAGLFPSLEVSKLDLRSSLNGDTRGLPGQPRARWRDVLVVGELAMTVLLLAAAGLLIRSFLLLRDMEPGFRPEKLIAFDLVRPLVDFNDPRRSAVPLRPFFEQAVRQLEQLPGVQAAAAISTLPLTGRLALRAVTPEGRSAALRAHEELRVDEAIITPAYFSTMGIALVQGRTFSADDTLSSPSVAVVDEIMARQFWPGEEAVGKRLRVGAGSQWTTVVGVVRSARAANPATPPPPRLFRPLAQEETMMMSLVVRGVLAPSQLVKEARGAIARIDPNQPISKVLLLQDLLHESVALPRFRSLLMGSFAGLALVLAAAGIYGVTSCLVTRRTREIGLRLALGASRGGVLRMVLGQGLKLTLAGIALGGVAALGTGRLLWSFLFGVAPYDPLSFCGAGLLPLLIAILAGYLPARRAMRIDPMAALRRE